MLVFRGHDEGIVNRRRVNYSLTRKHNRLEISSLALSAVPASCIEASCLVTFGGREGVKGQKNYQAKRNPDDR